VHPVVVELRRYWIEFDRADAPIGMTLGCGVTAFDLADAMQLVADAVGAPCPEAERVTVDVDVSTLDELHVLPNMYPPSERGIWFPMLGPLT
jgi:hypothetical protein